MCNQATLIPVKHKREICDFAGVWVFLDVLGEVAMLAPVWMMVAGPKSVIIGAVVTVALLALVVEAFKSMHRRRVRRRVCSLPGGGEAADTESRLVCYGQPCELYDLTSLSVFPTVPKIFRDEGLGATGRTSSSTPGGMAMIVIYVSVGGLVLIYFMESFAITLCAFVFFKWGSDFVLGQLSGIHYRIVPGAVDIMRFRPWSVEARSCVRIDLRNSSVVCRFDGATVDIESARSSDSTKGLDLEGPAEEHSRVTIDLRRMRRPHAFVKSLFEAAICKSDPPPLPDEHLVG